MQLLLKKLNRCAIVIPGILLAGILFTGCGDGSSGPNFNSVPPPFDTTQAVSKTEMDNGLIIYVIEEGGGVFSVVETDIIRLFFTGRTVEGRVFDSSYRNESTTPRTISNLTPVPQQSAFGQVLPLMKGLRMGLLGMKEGEKRTLVIPPSLGWEPGTGVIDSTVVNLKGKTLIFDVELDDIR